MEARKYGRMDGWKRGKMKCANGGRDEVLCTMGGGALRASMVSMVHSELGYWLSTIGYFIR
jgi:hypothetical protein